LFVVLGCGMHERVPAQSASMELNGDTGIVFVNVKLELAGVVKLALNFHNVNPSDGAP